MSTIRNLRATLAISIVATIVWAPVSASAATFVITPSAMGGWSISNEDANNPGAAAVANGVFVDGPAAPPAGGGSFKQVAAQGHKSYLHTNLFDLEPLSTLSISFSTYTTDPGPTILTSAINMSVDKDGDQISDTTLVFEPYDGGLGATATGVWQDWTTIENGDWWSTNDGGPGVKDTLAGWDATFGGTSTIASSNPFANAAFRIVVGSSGASWPDIETYVDSVDVNGDVYDFEQDPVTVVHPGALNGWSPSTTGGAVASFVLGPTGQPLGVGSHRQAINGAGGFARVTTQDFSGTPIAGLDLHYDTYVTSNNGAQAPALKLRIDTTGDGVSDETLVFEPAWQNGSLAGTPVQCGVTCPQLGVWETWDAGAGAWWSTSGSPGGPPTTTLFDYAKANPGATIATLNAEPLALESGSSGPSWVGTSATVDEVHVNGSVYDFEPLIGSLDCSSIANDMAAIQGIVDSAPDGFVLQLDGTCDFTAAPAHGGDITSIANSAVLIRPGTPINGLTITSVDPADPATILGSGNEAAFTIGPDNDDVTIRGLRFVNLGRAVVAIDTDSTTIGVDDGTFPSPAANRIIGNAGMDDAILGLAIDRNAPPGGPAYGVVPPGQITINYGANGANSATLSGSGGTLTNFNVLGNYISYDPPGAETGTTQLAAIAIRQRGANAIDGVLAKHNAVGFFASEFPTSNMNSFAAHSLNSVATTTAADYLIRNVDVLSNNFGRLEEIAALSNDAADVHGAGRIGIVLTGVSNFNVHSNGVRVRMSPTGIPMPGGAIVAADSGFGKISGNSAIVLTDPSTINSDMGSIGIVDDFIKAFAPSSPGKAQSTTDIEVTKNRIGPLDGQASLAQRGLVVTRAANVVAHRNDFHATSGPAVNLGVDVIGPGSPTDPNVGQVPLPKGVTSSVVCDNDLDSTPPAAGFPNDPTVHGDDEPSEITVGAGATDVTSSAFPGGALIPTDNVDCIPTISLDLPLLNDASGDLTASGKAWPNRSVSVTLANLPTQVTKSTTAAANGDYSVVFAPADWGTVNDGTIDATATALDVPTGANATSAAVQIEKDTVGPTIPVITAPTDGDLVPPDFTVVGTGPAQTLIKLYDGGTQIGSVTSNSLGGWTIPLTGQSGTLVLTAEAFDAADNPSGPSAPVTVTVDASVPAPPVITEPICGTEINTNDVTIAGTTTAGYTVKVRKLSPAPVTLLGQDVADAGGNWSVTVNDLPDGNYVVAARAFNLVSTPSGDATCAFQVRTDFIDPDIPDIITPEDGSTQPALVNITGTAEPGTIVRVIEGPNTLVSAQAQADGTWATTFRFSNGTHTITAIARDASGNDSDPAVPHTFNVDGIKPRVTITTPELIPQLIDLNVQGTASDNVGVDRVEIEVVDTIFGTTTTGLATLDNPGGTLTGWTYTAPVSTCICQVRATSYDAAGNRSAQDAVTIIEVG